MKFLPADIPLFIHGDDDDDFIPPMEFDDDERGDDFIGNDDGIDGGDGGGGYAGDGGDGDGGDDQPGDGDGGDDQPGDGDGGDDQPGTGEGGDDQPGDGAGDVVPGTGDGEGGDGQPGTGEGGDDQPGNGGGDDQPGTGDGGDDQPGAGEGGDDQPGTGDGGEEGNGEGNGDGDNGGAGDNGGTGSGGDEPGDGNDEGGDIPNDEGNGSTAVVPPSTASNATDNSNPAPGGGDRRMVRHLDGTDEDPPKPDSFIDIALFKLPDGCANTFEGCDWADLGVGAHDEEVDGGVNYCCSQDAASRGICDESTIGRLIVSGSFTGETHKIFVPGDNDTALVLETGSHMEIKNDGSYVLVLANCDDNGREMLALGTMEWMSSHGLLPGDLLGLLFYYVIIFLIYLVLFIGYGCGMRAYQDSAIPIQRYIIGTIGLGLIETFFLTVDLVVLNQSGSQSMFVVYAGKYWRFGILGDHQSIMRLNDLYLTYTIFFPCSHCLWCTETIDIPMLGCYGLHGLGYCSRFVGYGIGQNHLLGYDVLWFDCRTRCFYVSRSRRSAFDINGCRRRTY